MSSGALSFIEVLPVLVTGVCEYKSYHTPSGKYAVTEVAPADIVGSNMSCEMHTVSVNTHQSHLISVVCTFKVIYKKLTKMNTNFTNLTNR